MRPRTRRSVRGLRALTLGLLLGGVFAAACSSSAEAFPLVNGPVTITPTTSVASGQDLKSGQTINITVAANSTLDRTNLSAFGFPSGVAVMKALECDDPDGLASNLPTKEAYHCDGNTIQATAYVNADGSFKIDNFVVYSLPDEPTFDEGPGSLPACGTQANQCVLYIGPDQEDFSKPHLFSSPFLVTPTSNDQGLGVVSGKGTSGSVTSSDSGSSGGTLAFTGIPLALPAMVGSGILLVVSATEARRRLRHRVGP